MVSAVLESRGVYTPALVLVACMGIRAPHEDVVNFWHLSFVAYHMLRTTYGDRIKRLTSPAQFLLLIAEVRARTEHELGVLLSLGLAKSRFQQSSRSGSALAGSRGPIPARTERRVNRSRPSQLAGAWAP